MQSFNLKKERDHMKLNKFEFLVVGLLFFCFAVPAHAWQVKIYNPNKVGATVQLWMSNLKAYNIEVVIAAHSSYTYETGTKCPYALSGSIEGIESLNKYIRTTCLGPRREDTDIFIIQCGANCVNSEWTIVRHSDQTWHFKKSYNADDHFENWEPPVWVRPDWINPDSAPPDWFHYNGDR